MLENYVEDFNEHRFVREYQLSRHTSYSKAAKLLKRQIKNEDFYCKRVRQALEKRYRSAYIVEMPRNVANHRKKRLPAIMMIYYGHFFGFEIRRPLFANDSGTINNMMRRIELSGGTVATVTWPEEAIQIIEEELYTWT